MRVLLFLLVAPATATWDGNIADYGDCPLGHGRYKTAPVGCCFELFNQQFDHLVYQNHDILWSTSPPWHPDQIGWMQSGNAGQHSGDGHEYDELCYFYDPDKCAECVPGRYVGENTRFDDGFWEGAHGACNFCGLCCQQCSKGQYQNEAGQTGCKSCPAGQYQDMDLRRGTYDYDNNQPTSCTSCPAGTHIYCFTMSSTFSGFGFSSSIAADTSPDTCSGFVYRDRGKPCVACAAGKFADRRFTGDGICWQCWMRNTWAPAGWEQQGDPFENGGIIYSYTPELHPNILAWYMDRERPLREGHQSNCRLCPDGFVSNADHTGCDACWGELHVEYDYLLHSYYVLGLLSGQAAVRGASASAYN